MLLVEMILTAQKGLGLDESRSTALRSATAVPAFRSEMKDPPDGPNELFRFAGAQVRIHFLESMLARACERDHLRSRIRLAEADDQIDLIFFRDAVPDDDQVEVTSAASYPAVVITQRRNRGMARALQHQFAGAQERFVVRDG